MKLKRGMGLLLIALLWVVWTVSAQAGGGCDEGFHDFDMVDVKYPTCTTDGYYVLKCKNCGHTQKEITDKATGCDYEDRGKVEPTCTTSGFHAFVCKNCGDLYTEDYEPLGHDWKDDGVIYPDCENPGVEKNALRPLR